MIEPLNENWHKIGIEWHPTKNLPLLQENMHNKMRIGVWWRHKDTSTGKIHEWPTSIYKIVKKGRCEVCDNRYIQIGVNDLATLNSEIASEWHPTLNGNLTPQMVGTGCDKKVWWKKEHNEINEIHEWPARISNRARREVGCAVCDGRYVQVGVNDLVTKNPDLALQWHPTLNGSLLPTMVSEHSGTKVIWQHIDKDTGKEHVWPATVNVRTAFGCPICKGRIVIPGINDLATVEPKIASQWHPTLNGKLLPTMVSRSSPKRIYWTHKVKESGDVHIWLTQVCVRTNGGSQCSECFPGGFNSNFPAHLYLLNTTLLDKDNIEIHVVQFGITNNIKTRLRSHKSSGFTSPPILLIPFKKGLNALHCETSLKRLMREYDVPTASQRGIKFDGSTESFLLEDALENEDFLEEFNSLVGLM